jgi:hypothetical protein
VERISIHITNKDITKRGICQGDALVHDIVHTSERYDNQAIHGQTPVIPGKTEDIRYVPTHRRKRLEPNAAPSFRRREATFEMDVRH